MIQEEAPGADPPKYTLSWSSDRSYAEGFQDGFAEGYSRAWKECWEHMRQLAQDQTAGSEPEYKKESK